MATTLRLDIEEEELPFDFLGVSCADAGHRFCWNLNRKLGTRLAFHIELEVTHKKRPPTRHCVWRHEDELGGWSFDVVWNRSPEGAMIPTLVHFDYLLRIESMIGEQAERLMDSLRSMRRVAACFPVEASSVEGHAVLHYE
ncbi:MAG: hypothetical protein VXY61_05745 [Bacteroidota bacterium]|jgi:hypothetical protein|nr:hypothetical protein [Bacteroidota bacterium]MEC8597838.1 hypothetical protein [Bacteroidota bacterium]